MVWTSSEFVETIEGKTRLLVPASSLSGKVPPKVPAFFNPSAKLNRDISVLVYKTFVPEIKKILKLLVIPLEESELEH